MTHDDLVTYCLARPGAVRDHPFGPDPVAKVGGRIFAFLGRDAVWLKCGRDPDEAGELRLRHPADATVAPYLGRFGWNAVRFDGGIEDDELLELVDDSYDAVVARLPRRLRPA